MMLLGGITTVETARRFPGAARGERPERSGAVLALGVAAENGLARAVAFEHRRHHRRAERCWMTGVATLAPVRGGAPAYRFIQGSGLPVQDSGDRAWWKSAPAAGSIARRDALGRIQVGPDRRPRFRCRAPPARPRRHGADR
jgi:N-methylhydantoinase A